jgi:hypothetical protein
MIVHYPNKVFGAFRIGHAEISAPGLLDHFPNIR